MGLVGGKLVVGLASVAELLVGVIQEEAVLDGVEDAFGTVSSQKHVGVALVAFSQGLVPEDAVCDGSHQDTLGSVCDGDRPRLARLTFCGIIADRNRTIDN